MAPRPEVFRVDGCVHADFGDCRSWLVDGAGRGDVRGGGGDSRLVAADEARHQRVDRRAEREVLRVARMEALMYRRILVAVENSGADRTIINHISELAKLT